MNYEPKVYENKRVVLITGAESNWFEQAIFIVKKDHSRAGVDVVREAERIIENYLNKDKGAYITDTGAVPPAEYKAAQRTPRHPRKKTTALWNAVTFLCFLAILAMLAYRFL